MRPAIKTPRILVGIQLFITSAATLLIGEAAGEGMKSLLK